MIRFRNPETNGNTVRHIAKHGDLYEIIELLDKFAASIREMKEKLGKDVDNYTDSQKALFNYFFFASKTLQHGAAVKIGAMNVTLEKIVLSIIDSIGDNATMDIYESIESDVLEKIGIQCVNVKKIVKILSDGLYC